MLGYQEETWLQIWTRMGKIYMRANERMHAVVISSEKDLKKLPSYSNVKINDLYLVRGKILPIVSSLCAFS